MRRLKHRGTGYILHVLGIPPNGTCCAWEQSGVPGILQIQKWIRLQDRYKYTFFRRIDYRYVHRTSQTITTNNNISTWMLVGGVLRIVGCPRSEAWHGRWATYCTTQELFDHARQSADLSCGTVYSRHPPLPVYILYTSLIYITLYNPIYIVRPDRRTDALETCELHTKPPHWYSLLDRPSDYLFPTLCNMCLCRASIYIPMHQ